MGFMRSFRGSRCMIRGLVLAGGKSVRFGADKALAVYDGKSFLDRAVSLLASLKLKPIVVTRQGADYPPAGCAVIRDQLFEKGPLGGIYTAMTVFKSTSFLVLPCDMPGLTPETLSDLLAAHEPQFGITAYSTESGIQPFPGIYEPSLLGVLRSQLKQDSLSMQSLLNLVPAKKMINWKGAREIFCNINYKSDLIGNQ